MKRPAVATAGWQYRKRRAFRRERPGAMPTTQGEAMTSNKSKLAAVALGAMMAGGTFGAAIPALAAPPAAEAASCSGNVTCAFDGYNYTYFLGSRSPGTGLQDITSANRNKLTGWINYTTTGSRFYYNTGGFGTCVPMYAQNRATAISGQYNPDNNQAESWAFTRTC